MTAKHKEDSQKSPKPSTSEMMMRCMFGGPSHSALGGEHQGEIEDFEFWPSHSLTIDPQLQVTLPLKASVYSSVKRDYSQWPGRDVVRMN